MVFICPTLRVRPIYDELIRRLNEGGRFHEENDNLNSIILENNKHIIIKTWAEILGTIRLHLVQTNEQVLLSDLDQIIGFCNTIDNNAFLPISNDDMSPGIARKINSYYELIDKVAGELIKRGFANSTGLKATAKRYGYIRYLNIGNFGVGLSLKFHYWEKHADTPFWITFYEKKTKGWWIPEVLKSSVKKVASEHKVIFAENRYLNPSFALLPLFDMTEDIVVDNMAKKIILLSEALEKRMKDARPGILEILE